MSASGVTRVGLVEGRVLGRGQYHLPALCGWDAILCAEVLYLRFGRVDLSALEAGHRVVVALLTIGEAILHGGIHFVERQAALRPRVHILLLVRSPGSEVEVNVC